MIRPTMFWTLPLSVLLLVLVPALLGKAPRRGESPLETGRPGPGRVPAVKGGSIFAKENLLAWCIVPFDAKKRGPKERVEMLLKLGIRRVAYDWRGHHVPTWDEEMALYKTRGIELIGFWGFSDGALSLMKRHGIRTQFWVTMGGRGKDQAERVKAAAGHVETIARKAKEAGCTVALYNHGGWAGEPENQIEVIELLKTRGVGNVGICYNLHHGHHRMKDFAAMLKKMRPYLWCLNLNGMKPGTKILPFGQGPGDAEILRAIRKSGYRGPIGILGHRANIDVEVALRQNLDGMKAMLKKIGDTDALKTYK